MTLTGLIGSLVPRPCTRDHAQRAEKLLRLVIDAIWFVHGDAMACALLGAPHQRQTDASPRAARSRTRSFHGAVQRLLPGGWNSSQALRAVTIVEIAIEAVWEVHHAEEADFAAFADAVPPPGEDDEDIPF